MTQTFSVNSQKLNEFKKNLAELISDFAAESESVDGDAIAEVVIGFTSNV